MSQVRFGDRGSYWEYFDDAVKEETDDAVRAMKENLDNLLIFVR